MSGGLFRVSYSQMRKSPFSNSTSLSYQLLNTVISIPKRKSLMQPLKITCFFLPITLFLHLLLWPVLLKYCPIWAPKLNIHFFFNTSLILSQNMSKTGKDLHCPPGCAMPICSLGSGRRVAVQGNPAGNLGRGLKSLLGQVSFRRST